MAVAKILTGARAKILINGNVVGLFSQCQWSIRQGKEAQFALGRYNPTEITPTTQEAIQLSLTGYRVVNSGPYKVANATLLQNLLNEEDFNVSILDRQTNTSIFAVAGCRVQGWSSGVAARGVSDIRIDIIGLVGDDEFLDPKGTVLDSDIGATNLDDGT
jgi:hypothetical protein